MSVQRWTVADLARMSVVPALHGDLVLYADHVAALAEAEQRVRTDLVTSVLDGIAVLEGRRLVFLSDVRDAIARLPRNADTRDALAAIDALNGEQA